MVELVDTRDLKSLDPKRSCGFESRSRHLRLFPIVMTFIHNIFTTILLSAAVLIIASCGNARYDVTIDGRLLNINQAKFLVFSPDGAIAGIDTIHVQGGRFSYETDLRREGTLVIVFPNFRTVPVFVEKGCNISIDGNVAQLKTVEVTGSKTNNRFTEWRKNTSQQSPRELEKLAEKFVKENPESPISQWMRMQYLSRVDHPAIGELMPSFTAVDIDGQLVNNEMLRNGTTVILVWSSWNYDSQNAVRQVANNMRSTDNRNIDHAVAICIDADPNRCRSMRNTQNAGNVIHICDGKMIDTPLLKTLGLSTFPANIKLKNGTVVARNLPTYKLTK